MLGVGKLEEIVLENMKVSRVLAIKTVGGTSPASMTLWRNGSASDSRSEGCVFESRQGHQSFFFVRTYNQVDPLP